MVKTRELRGAFSEAHTLTYKLLTGGKRPESKKRPATGLLKKVARVMESHFKQAGVDEGEIAKWREWYGRHRQALKEFEPVTKDGKIGMTPEQARKLFDAKFIRIFHLISDTVSYLGEGKVTIGVPSTALGEGYTPLHFGEALSGSATEGIHAAHHQASGIMKTDEHHQTRATVSEALELMLKNFYPSPLTEYYTPFHQRAAYLVSGFPDSMVEEKHAGVIGLWLAKKNPKTFDEADKLICSALIQYSKDKNAFIEKATRHLGWEGREAEMYKTLTQLKRLLKERG
jgi:hypothetical protein